MTNTKEGGGRVQWRIRVDGSSSSETLVLESKVGQGFKALIRNLLIRICSFFEKARYIAVDDPRKVIHCLKVGIALTVVSLFYYVRPLYEGFGGNAIWAVMTVVVVFEYTVGATLYKCLNRVSATFLAGFLGLGIQWVANQSGEKIEPIITGISIFLLASATTFSRFIPVVKARFDYGASIFILTFCLVSVSGYRVEKLIDIAQQRLSTIIIGISLCIFVSMLVCPIWAGLELHLLITRNMDKLANSLESCVAEYFNSCGNTTSRTEESKKNMLSHKCVLNSKASEESMAGFARWEPAHGRFHFQHPWKQYLKIGASVRNCAYCVETLNSCLSSRNQSPELIKKYLNDVCSRVSYSSSSVIRDLATTITTMRRSSKIDISLEEMNTAVKELQDNLKSIPALVTQPQAPEAKTENRKIEPILTKSTTPIMEVIPLVTFASLLIDFTTRIQGIVEAVEELSKLAEFKHAADDIDTPPKNQHMKKIATKRQDDEGFMTTLQRV